MLQPYSREVEQQMQRFYSSLSEKDRRRYAAVEAMQLSRGGLSYIGQLLKCDDEALQMGQRELADADSLSERRIRREGGGRKAAWATIAGLEEAFLSVIAKHTAGSPMDETLQWTNLTRQEIAEQLRTEGISISVSVVDQLLEKHNYRKRKTQKRLATGTHPQRNEQFENIDQRKTQDQAVGHPVLSMDTKKRINWATLPRGTSVYPG